MLVVHGSVLLRQKLLRRRRCNFPKFPGRVGRRNRIPGHGVEAQDQVREPRKLGVSGAKVYGANASLLGPIYRDGRFLGYIKAFPGEAIGAPQPARPRCRQSSRSSTRHATTIRIEVLVQRLAARAQNFTWLTDGPKPTNNAANLTRNEFQDDRRL